MKKLILCVAAFLSTAAAFAANTPPTVMAFYAVNVEPDHRRFAEDAIRFFAAHAKGQYKFVPTTNWDDLNDATLAQCAVVLWLNDEPHSARQQQAFQKYMTHGGAWLGFHVAGYTEKKSDWPWYQTFLGGIWDNNSWPPIPADLNVTDPNHPVTRGLPPSFESPANEWYSWDPNPAFNKNVKVLLTLAPGNYPLGLKDVLTSGTIPIVWTNTQYKMLYINMGHGDKIFTSPIQNRLIENSLLWLLGKR